MNKLISIAVITGSLLLAGCASGPTKEELRAEYKQVSAQAKDALKQADKLENAWRDTAKNLKKADALVANKDATTDDLAKAVKMAKKAKFEADMAIKQHADEAGATPPKELR